MAEILTDITEPPECPICSRANFYGHCSGCGFTEDLEDTLARTSQPPPGETVGDGGDGDDHHSRPPSCSFLTGAAGTGKTTIWRNRIAEDPYAGRLCATTGIAAVNLDTVTIQSVLKYFDTASLEDKYIHGGLHKAIRGLIESGYKALVVDEVSMMPAEQLQLIYAAANDVAEAGHGTLDLVITGDMCQLPPIKAPFVFEAACWPEFEVGTTKLDKVWRQDNPLFLQAINSLRKGDGKTAGGLLMDCRVPFSSVLDTRFNGTTIIAKNEEVSKFNSLRLQLLKGDPIYTRPSRWGMQVPEWGRDDLIPNPFVCKLEALVMILVNDTEGFTYANGDLATVKEWEPKAEVFTLELARNGQEVRIGRHTKKFRLKDKPKPEEMPDGGRVGRQPQADERMKGWWVCGEVSYHPLRLAYATTVHKSQGLTLDRVQIDLTSHFMGSPGMLYVAASRARNPQGMRVVGKAEKLVERCKVDKRVGRWI